MSRLTLKKFGIYWVDLPVQNITKRGEDGRQLTVGGTEMYGNHLCICLVAAPDNQFAVVAPLTSATNQNGEKWTVKKDSWLRVIHENRPAYIQLEQIRYADRGRFLSENGRLGDYDTKQLCLKLKNMLALDDGSTSQSEVVE